MPWTCIAKFSRIPCANVTDSGSSLDEWQQQARASIVVCEAQGVRVLAHNYPGAASLIGMPIGAAVVLGTDRENARSMRSVASSVPPRCEVIFLIELDDIRIPFY